MEAVLTKVALLTLAILSIALYTSLVRSPTPTQQRVLFAVWAAQKGKKPDAPLLDPIVIVEGSELRKLQEYDYGKQKESDEAFERFEKIYFRQGQEYPLFFGGGKLGTVVVDKAAGISCVSRAAIVRTTVPVPNGQDALAATTVQGLGLHANWRQPATTAQRSAFLELAADFLSKRASISVTPPAIAVKNLRSTKLGVGRPDALIGSITFKEKSAAHNLFLVAVQRDAQWDIAISSYHFTKDVEDYTDDVEENFVDQLDLDNDGVDEVVTISGYYESWDYTIYKKRKGKWEKVYQGGGGGC